MAEQMHVDRQVTRGNIGSMLTTLIGFASVIASVVWLYTNTDAKTAENERSIGTLGSRMRSAESAIQSLQISNARTNAQYESLARSMNEVKAELREIGNMLREERRAR